MTLLAKLFNLTVTDITDTPFTPDYINGKPVLVVVGNKALTA